jgi:hypothetical protein
MGDAYANADCIIAAAAAWDCSEAFPTAQTLSAISPCLVGVEGQKGVNLKAYMPSLMQDLPSIPAVRHLVPSSTTR